MGKPFPGKAGGADLAATRRALLLINPNSRRGAEASDTMPEKLQQGGLDVRVEQFSSPDEAGPHILERRDEIDCVVVAGGDGTLNAVSSALTETGLPMGILPMGTANDLARTLGIPNDLDQAAEIVIQGRTRRIDLGMANDQPFFNVASMGLSVELAAQLGHETKRRWGRLGYAFAALKVLANARPFRAWISSDGTETKVRTLQIAVGNGRHYGGGNVVEKTATIDDARLDLYSLEMRNVWKLALMLRTFRTGEHGIWSEVRNERGTEFDIRTRRPRSINTDGEVTTRTPVHFRVLPKAITVYAPADE